MKNMHFNNIKKSLLSAGKIRIDKKGNITSLKNITKAPNREFSPADTDVNNGNRGSNSSPGSYFWQDRISFKKKCL